MVFSSHLFFYYFLPSALGLYFLAPRRLRHLALTVLSYLFYGWANPLFVVLLFVSTAIDYCCGRVMAETLPGEVMRPLAVGGPRSTRARWALWVSIVANLSLLGFFKYFGFLSGSWDSAVTSLGLPTLVLAIPFHIVLPLGISFYTFQSMSYSIDVYRGHATALRSFVDFACYVSMFPQLVAGPILRFSEVEAQLREREHSWAKAARGVSLLALGMAKKVLLANPCGKLADHAFGADAIHALDAWLGAVAYSFQIYYDFSGYSDMAIGLGLMLGFTFSKNFDSPYRSRSLTEFWRRWHISLSAWLRDYLYLPLGGNRLGSVRTYVNLAVVMLLGGLWHGAEWTFVVWGGLHGAMLASERWRGQVCFYERLPVMVQVGLTYVLVTLAWVPFRSDSLMNAQRYWMAMFGAGGSSENAALLSGVIREPYLLLMVASAAVVCWSLPQAWDFTRTLSPARAGLCLVALVASLIAMASQEYNPFIYFIF